MIVTLATPQNSFSKIWLNYFLDDGHIGYTTKFFKKIKKKPLGQSMK
jgi:hypothetical protein